MTHCAETETDMKPRQGVAAAVWEGEARVRLPLPVAAAALPL